jgi:hypothetical protein
LRACESPTRDSITQLTRASAPKCRRIVAATVELRGRFSTTITSSGPGSQSRIDATAWVTDSSLPQVVTTTLTLGSSIGAELAGSSTGTSANSRPISSALMTAPESTSSILAATGRPPRVPIR